MDPQFRSALANGVLLLHLGVILFNLFGLIAIPVGAWRKWRFVYIFWWRALHLFALAAVALQALFHRACFLTVWQTDLLQPLGHGVGSTPLISGWINGLIYWPFPLWAFTLLYVATYLYTLALWRLVPPRRNMP